jgi:hypothetical protein
MKALVSDDDPIRGFTMIGPEAGEVVAVVQTAMLAGLPYTGLRYAILAHPTMVEGTRLPIFECGTSACTTRHAEKRRRVTDGKSASHRAADVLLILEILQSQQL